MPASSAYPKSIAQVNAHLRSLGMTGRWVAGDAYYYWLDEDGNPIDAGDGGSMYVFRASFLTFGEWEQHSRENGFLKPGPWKRSRPSSNTGG